MTKIREADNLTLPPLPEMRFPCLAIDPPWHYRSRGVQPDESAIRSPQRHYPTMDIPHLEQLPVREIATPDANVFLWMTGPMMALGVHNKLFRAWGVKASSIWLVWIKLWNEFDASQLQRTPLLENDLAINTGYTTRQNAEFVVLGRIGNGMPRRRADIRQVLVSNRREHSRKPDEFYRRVEHYSDGPRIDMFAGADRKGWTRYGWGHRAGEGDRHEAQA